MTYAQAATTGALNAEPSLPSERSETDLPPKSYADATFQPEQHEQHQHQQKHADKTSTPTAPTVVLSVSEYVIWQETQPAAPSSLTSPHPHPPKHEVSRDDGIYHCDCNNDPFHSQMAFHHHHTHVGRASYPDEVLVSSYAETPGAREKKRHEGTEMEHQWERMRLRGVIAGGKGGQGRDGEGEGEEMAKGG